MGECRGLSSYREVLDWCEPKVSWATLVRGLSPRTCEPRDTPRTLVCHDMKGGYIQDRFVDGCDDSEAYRFVQWSKTDIFVYFSHHLVTIPPLGWINSAHTHGVPILGTFITEWKDGSLICDQFLKDDASVESMVDRLVRICRHYKFDGYLVNIENKLPPYDAFRMVTFLELLKARLGEGSLVIWYDSVVLPTGELKWQNKLNNLNKPFFDACDGIFLNYTWKEEDLKLSRENSGARWRDVFVGIDVFGRNCYAGGGFNTHLAVELVNKYDLSVALFGVGWSHECRSEGETFDERERKLWAPLSEHLAGTRGPAGPLPFTTSFCQGYGTARFKQGLVVSEKSWYNLSEQCCQPAWPVSDGCLEVHTADAFNGGSSLSVSTHHLHRLLVCSFQVEGKAEVSLVTKRTEGTTAAHLRLVLHLVDSSNNTRKVSLEETATDTSCRWVPPSRLYKTNGWTISCYEVECAAIREVLCSSNQRILLGQISLRQLP